MEYYILKLREGSGNKENNVKDCNIYSRLQCFKKEWTFPPIQLFKKYLIKHNE